MEVITDEAFGIDQIAKPNSDTGVDWSQETGCTGTTHWDCLNEPIRDDSDFITSNLISTSNSDIDFIGLSSITDPLKSDGHVIRVVAREQGVGVNAPFLLVDLLDGATTIATLNIPQGSLTTTFQEFNYTLTDAEADTIVNYNGGLEFRFEASCVSGTCSAGSSRERVDVSFAEFVILDQVPIPPPTLDTVSVINSTALQINFTEPVNTSQVLSYNIERNDGTGFVLVGNVIQGMTTFDDIDLSSDTFYSYRIISVGASENSISSNIISQRTTVILFSSQPDSNIGVRWVNGLGLLPCEDTATYACVDEEIRNDNDFIQSLALGSGGSDTDSFTMSDIEDPLISDSHFLKYTIREAGVGNNQPQFEIELRQGATVIATFTHPQGSLTDSYQLFSQELSQSATDQISDYSNLEIEIRATCPVGCSNQERERLNVSWIVFEIEQVNSPEIKSLDTLSSSSMRLSWLSIEIDPEINEIIVQRTNGSNFINIANLSTSIESFDELGLEEQTVYKFRLRGKTATGITIPSFEVEGATPPSSATLNSDGLVKEPNPINSFSQLRKQTFAQTAELFNVPRSTVTSIIIDIEINQLNAFQIIDKILNGTYDASQTTKNLGAYYGTKYINFTSANQFIDSITDDVRLALEPSSNQGNVPNAGKEPKD